MIKKCLFPAAGYGTRFLPATKTMPKEMLPIINKPLIQFGVEEALDAGCQEIAIVTGRGKRSIEDYFDINYELENEIKGTPKEQSLSSVRKIIENATFSYTRQNKMLGLGHAILTGQTLLQDDPFAVILADDLCINKGGKGVLAQIVEIYARYKCSIVAVQEVDPNEVQKYGIISGKEIEPNTFKVECMVEKPKVSEAPSNLAIIGRYILTPDIFKILKHAKPGKNGEIQITDALNTQAKSHLVLAYKFSGERFDCGSVDGFVRAINTLYKEEGEF
ncbi:MAG: UTP--glucose-1-phosphate uridylyltransferase GalU [Helicobacter sp.]|nr:UTP--glucose-1-phosphate uridylyltransferase GalU [Helicobacter sp.]